MPARPSRLDSSALVMAPPAAGGGPSGVARGMRALEAALAARRCDDLTDTIAAAPLAELTPVDDCRATAVHRLHLARLAVSRAFTCCIEENARGPLPA